MLGGCQSIKLSLSCAVIGWEVALPMQIRESAAIISDASSKMCSAQAGLPGPLKPCAEILSCEGDVVEIATNVDGVTRSPHKITKPRIPEQTPSGA